MTNTPVNIFATYNDWHKMLPVLGAFVIVNGYINILSYYLLFDIRVYSFIETSEILLAFTVKFLQNFLLMAIPFLLAAVPVFKDRYIIQGDSIKPRGFSFAPSEQTPILLGSLMFLIIASIVFYFSFKASLDLERNPPPIGASFLFPAVALLILIHVSINRNVGFVSRFTISMIVAFVVTTASILLSNYSAYRRLVKGEPISFVQLDLNDGKKLETSDTVLFIGSTRNYYFFRNIKSDINIIIPVSGVQRIRTRDYKRPESEKAKK